MAFRFDDKARQAVTDALLEVSPTCHDKVERAITDVEQAIDRYLFAKGAKKERPSEAKKSLKRRLRSSKPMSRIIAQCRPQERAWLRMAQASARFHKCDPNDKEVIAERLDAICFHLDEDPPSHDDKPAPPPREAADRHAAAWLNMILSQTSEAEARPQEDNEKKRRPRPRDLAFDLLLQELLDIFVECTGERPTWRDNWYAREKAIASQGEGEPMGERSWIDSNVLPFVEAAVYGAELNRSPKRIRYLLGKAWRRAQYLLDA